MTILQRLADWVDYHWYFRNEIWSRQVVPSLKHWRFYVGRFGVCIVCPLFMVELAYKRPDMLYGTFESGWVFRTSPNIMGREGEVYFLKTFKSVVTTTIKEHCEGQEVRIVP